MTKKNGHVLWRDAWPNNGTYGGRIFTGRPLDAVKKFYAQSRHVHRSLSAESFDTVRPSVRALRNQSARQRYPSMSINQYDNFDNRIPLYGKE